VSKKTKILLVNQMMMMMMILIWVIEKNQ